MRISIWSFNIPLSPLHPPSNGNPLGIWTFEDWFIQNLLPPPWWAKTVFKFLTKCRIRYLFIYLFICKRQNQRRRHFYSLTKLWNVEFEDLFFWTKVKSISFKTFTFKHITLVFRWKDHSGWNFPTRSDNFFSNSPPRGYGRRQMPVG